MEFVVGIIVACIKKWLDFAIVRIIDGASEVLIPQFIISLLGEDALPGPAGSDTSHTAPHRLPIGG